MSEDSGSTSSAPSVVTPKVSGIVRATNLLVRVVAVLMLVGGAVGLVVGVVDLDATRAAWSFGQLMLGGLLLYLSTASWRSSTPDALHDQDCKRAQRTARFDRVAHPWRSVTRSPNESGKHT